MATVNDLLTERIPPHHADAERAVLGGILLDGAGAIARLGGLTPEMFYIEKNRKIFTAVMAVAAVGSPVDLLVVTAALRDQPRGALKDVGGPVYLAQLVDEAGILPNLPRYAAMIREAALRREVIHRATAAMGAAYESGVSSSDLLGQVQQAATDLGALLEPDVVPPAAALGGPQPVGTVLEALWARIDERETDFVKSPIPALDNRLGGGLLVGEYAILGGRPGMSKTALAVQWAVLTASAGQPTLVVSREMTNYALARRLLAQECHVSATSLRQRDLAPDERRRIERALPRLTALPLWFDDMTSSIAQIRRHVRTLRPRFLVVDYLQLVRSPEGAKQQRRLEVTAVSAGLKAIAQQLGCCSVLGLSSLRRPFVETAGRRRRGQGTAQAQKRQPPSLEDLKESGDVEHDADVVLLLWQPSLQAQDREVIFAKLRDGQTGGSQPLDWDPVHTRFNQLSERAQEAPPHHPDPDDPTNDCDPVPF